MKQRYGSQGCYLLKINSRTLSTEKDEQIPDPWSQYLHRNSLHSQVRCVALSMRSQGSWSGSGIVALNYIGFKLKVNSTQLIHMHIHNDQMRK